MNSKAYHLIIALIIISHSLKSQIASKSNITLHDIIEHINKIETDDLGKKNIKKEADILSNSSKEEFANYSLELYRDILKDNISAERIKNKIIKKFPKGILEKSIDLDHVFKDKSLTAEGIEKKYNLFISKYFDSNSNEDTYVDDDPNLKLALLFYNEKNIDKTLEYISKTKKDLKYPHKAWSLVKKLHSDKEYTLLVDILEDYNNIIQKDSVLKSTFTRYIVPMHVESLIKTGKIEEAKLIVNTHLDTEDNLDASIGLLLVNEYKNQKKYNDALSKLEEIIIKKGRNSTLKDSLRSIYVKINNDDKLFENYYSTIENTRIQKEIEYYKKDIIKESALNFNLKNLNGDSVNLSDLRGKIIVLDFWATWCGPCKKSFPAMQKLVDLYKNDNDIEFLFIDTWEKDSDYKTVVQEFITKNNYTFNVLFDDKTEKDYYISNKYGATGIPYKVIIDKNGYIRFKSAGAYLEADKTLNEISTKIEMIRNNL
ncbi:TlpA family protein disulfide reductase [Sphingobacterium bovistauri]|uniref:TlpA family protein disulfide reductase n=1 Tax=Sphingobacterium bovistauri TaxID=2781959 RepID=A0ABS7Z8S7_9SPHI|nr:TlpA disulfide reductase family protein [Sphingobacterium bovistauri]MCA5005099.1 TlpA family protein disulfide reductase [Sphingobacterium bovistauri]